MHGARPIARLHRVHAPAWSVARVNLGWNSALPPGGALRRLRGAHRRVPRWPRQVVAPLAVRYEPQDNLVLEVHSHRDGLARFSATDSADEQRLRLYGVVGRLDQSIPQVALRAGAYGYFLPVPWDAVFDGDSDSIQDVLDASDLGLAQEPFEGWLEPGA